MFKRVLFLSFITVLFFVSCKPTYIRHGIKKINELQNSLLEVDNKLKTLDTTAIKQKYTMYMQSIALVKDIGDDAFTKDEWNTMTQYGQIRKPLRNFINQLPEFAKELDYSKMQLSNLEYDLKNKHLTSEQFDEFYKKENEAVSFFITMFDVNYTGAMSQVEAFDTLYPKMVLVIQNHSNKTRDE